jgi:hypothetical protein
MARIKAGIEIPIIPEDLEPSDNSFLSDIIESCLEASDRNYQDELHAVEWVIVESLLEQQP